MSAFFEELDYQETPIGAIQLRRRHDFRLKIDILEIILGDEHLMSDLFTASEIALATLGLSYHRDGKSGSAGLKVVVGGLGLGYTAQAVLADKAVERLWVVEALQAIIDWHDAGLLPLGAQLRADPRCQFICGDFFAWAGADAGFDDTDLTRKYDAILVDIDHAPDFHLAAGNASFYTKTGLTALQSHMADDGVFGLWSNDPPDAGFTAHLKSVFADARAEPVTFANPYQDNEVVQTVYLARK